LPQRFGELAQVLVWARGSEKWGLLYTLAWRIAGGDRGLLGRASDDDVAAAERLAKDVRRDIHKMHAFVRFREVDHAEAIDGKAYIAFHRPDHPIIRKEAGWFAKRFPAMTWCILTPDGSAAWDGRSLTFGPPATSDQAPPADDAEALWLTYYQNIFNPGRINERAMLREMPKKYWDTMPEAKLIPDLLQKAPDDTVQGKQDGLIRRRGKRADVPAGLALPQLAEAATRCRACDLCEPATQVVFGEGPADAALVFVGEQPGDQEDRAGRPFVGPAGQLLDELLDEAGVDRPTVYLTNSVKHFAFEPRGKRRIHRKPKVSEQRACQPWLEAELENLQPKVIVCLGATAAQNVIGRTFKLTPNLGQVQSSPWCDRVVPTYHPSAILRAGSTAPDRADAQRQQLLDDLTRARQLLQS
jgi:DNA polymerase